MQQTQNRGMLLRGEADYQLHLIYLWYEHQPMPRAQARRGAARPLSAQSDLRARAAVIQSDYLHNQGEPADVSIAARRRARRTCGVTRDPEVNARLGMAQQMDSAL